MNEIKLIINGKEVKLTEEQIKALDLALGGKLLNPFERVGKYEEYYCIKETGEIYTYYDDGGSFDNILYAESNYFNDEAFAKQVALHQLLYRKLLKFAYDNGIEDVEWDNKNTHWCIFYSHVNLKYEVVGFVFRKFADVWFSSEEGAKRAIKEVVEPFIKEHPEFVW